MDRAIEKLPTKIRSNFVENSPFEVIPMLMEFLKLKDLSMLYLEISVGERSVLLSPFKTDHSFSELAKTLSRYQN